jgi:hypothetical protein
MLKTYEVAIEDGQVKWLDDKPNIKSGRAIITILEEELFTFNPTIRPYALCAGEFRVPDDFDSPLPEDILQDFENPL